MKLNNNSQLVFQKLDVRTSVCDDFFIKIGGKDELAYHNNKLEIKVDSPEYDYIKNDIFYCGTDVSEKINCEENILRESIITFSVVSNESEDKYLTFSLTKEESLILANYLIMVSK